MLISAGHHSYEHESARDSIHNYYEHMVIEYLLRSSKRAQTDAEFLADVTCLALNRLPPRYVRHDVDMAFFMTPKELDEMYSNVEKAVNAGLDYLESRSGKHLKANEAR